jgi:hypothetical protein
MREKAGAEWWRKGPFREGEPKRFELLLGVFAGFIDLI